MTQTAVIVGGRAPDFSLPCTRVLESNKDHAALRDYLDRWLVLMFYPRDFSLVCPTELTALSARIDEFRERDCDVLAISTDAVETHERWIETPRSQGGLGGLNFPLGSDEDGSVCTTYGVLAPRQHLALRGLFIIDPNGVLQYQVVHNLSVGRRSDEVLRVLDALQTGGLCPEGWTPHDTNLDATRVLGPNSIVNQYRIEAKLGEGSFGSVFRAEDLTLRRTVALKVARPGDPELAAAVLAEARAAAAISHPNVCTVYSVDVGDGVSMIVMEFVHGQTLSALLQAGPLAAEQAAGVVRQAAAGMAAAHAHGVVHGDLKPANIMLTDDGVAKIMDFGLARRATRVLSATAETGDWGPTHSSAALSGTPSYMAPEQAQGESPTTASDVFSLGLVLFELLTGRRAISGDNILQVLRTIDAFDPEAQASAAPLAFRPLLRQVLALDPSQRISMADFAAALTDSVVAV